MTKQDTGRQDTESAANIEDPQRRELLKKAAKLATYAAPTITTLTFVPRVSEAFPSPNPPPLGDNPVQDRRRYRR